jgi:hypothetical protein
LRGFWTEIENFIDLAEGQNLTGDVLYVTDLKSSGLIAAGSNNEPKFILVCEARRLPEWASWA